MEHSLLSPSSAYRWMVCPASVALCQRLPEEGTSTYAAEGVLAHAIGELLLGAFKCNKLKPTIAKLQSTYRFEGVKIEKDMLTKVLAYVDAVINISSPARLAETELKVDLTEVYGSSTEEWGTADYVAITEDRELQIHDLKYGMVHVDVEENTQLIVYALGAYQKYHKKYLINKVRMIIHQPKLNAVSEYTLTSAELKQWGVKIKEQAITVKNICNTPDNVDTKYYIPTDDACRYCRAKSICEALERKVKSTLMSDFEDKSMEDAKKEIKDQTALFYSPGAHLGTKMLTVSLIRAWCKSVESNLLAQLLNGDSVEGWKLIKGKKPAGTWVDEEDTTSYVIDKRLSKYLIIKKLLTPAQAKKALKNKVKSWGSLLPFVKYKEPSPKMVTDSSKGVAYFDEGIIDDFEMVDEVVTEETPIKTVKSDAVQIDSNYNTVTENFNDLF